ncbi:MAG: hypothetical protein PSY12_11925 [bacterium]|nr:hypothetical protein [bacterium]
MIRRLWLAPLLLVASLQPARADTIPVGFAPPTDRTFAYRIDQHRPVEGKDSLFTTTRDLRFDRAGDGYILHVTLRTLDSDAAPSGAEPFRAALSPLVGIDHRFRLDASGHIVALDNIDAIWSAVEAGLQKMVASFAPDTPRHRAASNILTLFAGLLPEGRLALLAGEVQPLFLFAGSSVEDGAGRGVRTAAGSPLGHSVPVEGTLVVESRAGPLLTLAEKLNGQGVQVGMQYRLSTTSGLIEEQRRTLAVGTGTLTETRTLTPLKK